MPCVGARLTIESAGRDSRSDRWLSEGRRSLPLAVRRFDLHADPGLRGLSIKRVGCEWAVAYRFVLTIRCCSGIQHLYRQAYNKSQYPPDDFMIPFGKAKVVREGTDLSIITYGALVQRSLVAAKQAEQEGISRDHRST